ncbi:MAG: ABC transporter ATP-binding protein [Proteobacteria bacterium]|nr:ABC transporter ATP-binding protein [Pseudomonadota bacterium]
MSFLRLHCVTKRFGAAVALDNVTLQATAGSRTAIVGPSGSGKTTLLRLIAGFDVPDAGQVVLDGAVLADGPAALPAYRRGVGLVMQDGALFPHLSIADNIGFGLDRAAPNRAARIAELMRKVELDLAMSDRRPDALSGGQQQRVALARALAREPRMMLLDEPFSALDTGLRASTRRMVAALLADAGITTILVTHDQAEALSFADQLVVMANGKVCQAGTSHELYLRPRTPMVATFLGDAIILPAMLGAGYAACGLGRIPTEHVAMQGPRMIMLRPEQIALVPCRPSEGRLRGGPWGEIVDLDFGGSTCQVSIRLTATDRHPGQLLALPQMRRDLLDVGASVRLTVTGTAHVFDEGSPAD